MREGLAYRNWKSGAYGSEGGQYDKLARAIEIDCAAALRSCSWGRGQIMGFDHKMVGFDSVDAMVSAFMASEAAQIEAIVRFAAANKLDGTLRAVDRMTRSMPNDWRSFAKGYNGGGYEKNGSTPSCPSASTGGETSPTRRGPLSRYRPPP
ncbi:N-acetylmuramidase domain-containing protein OS=Bosea thiooxidans OX=53254 GN=SAMN05660750_03310 PE=4 SV=1 [Bosea thiooxidans]